MTNSDIRSKLIPYFTNLHYREVPTAQRAVGCLVLLDNVKTYDEIVADFESEENYKSFLRPVKALLTDSFCARNAWRAALYATGQNIDLNKAAQAFKVNQSDFYFLWDGLKEEDRDIIRHNAKESPVLLKQLAKEDLRGLMNRLSKFCKQIAYQKLRFLQTTDNAILMEDIHSELLTKALKMVRHYEHMSEDGKTHAILKIENYARSGIANYVTNMINFYTTKKRARVQNTTEICGTCDYCLAGHITHCRNAVNSFQATTLRIDLPANADNPASIASSLRTSLRPYDETLVEDEMLQTMLRGSSDELKNFVNIVTDVQTPEEFERWLQLHYDVRVDEITDDRKMTNYALEYLDLQKPQTRRMLQAKYNKYAGDRR
jgi:hypothetical protein